MGNPFHSYRKKHRLSQQKLADKLGVSRQLVGLIECGKRRITADNAIEWERALGVPRKRLAPAYFSESRP